MRRFALFVWCVVVVAPLSARDLKDLPTPGSPSSTPALYTFDTKQIEALPALWTNDYDACFLHASTVMSIAADGETETTTHEVIRINGKKALDRYGEHRTITFRPGEETVLLHTACVRKADGKVFNVETKHLQTRDVPTDYLVYDSSKQLVISMPNLAVGDVIDVRWTVKGKHPEFHGEFFQRYQFGDDRAPVREDIFEVTIAAPKKLTHAMFGLGDAKLEPIIVSKPTATRYVWKMTDRVPPKKEEGASASQGPEDRRPGVMVSTFDTWEAVDAWERKIRTPCWECTADLKAIVAAQTKNLTTPKQKAEALALWVKRNIRYVSSGEKHDFTPHAPSRTIGNRFGDCKDGAQLLAVLLKEVGIRSGLVSINTFGGGQILESVPSPWADHAILVVYLDGKEHWVDTTVTLSDWDFLPTADRDRVVYIVDADKTRIARSPKLTCEENKYTESTVIHLKASGAAACIRTEKVEGLAAMHRREEWYQTPAGERVKAYEKEIGEEYKEAEVTDLTIDEASLLPGNSATSKAMFTVPEAVKMDTAAEIQIAATRALGLAVMPAANKLGDPFRDTSRFEVFAPPGMELVGKESHKDLEGPCGKFSAHVTKLGASWLIEFETKIENTSITSEDFLAQMKFQSDVREFGKIKFALKPIRNLETLALEIARLRAVRMVLPSDPDVSDALIEVRTRQAKLNGPVGVAELVSTLKLALKYHEDDTTLLKLLADHATTAVDLESAYSRLIKLDEDNPEYYLEYARKLADRGDVRALRALQKKFDKSLFVEDATLGALMQAETELASKKYDAAVRRLLEAEKKAEEDFTSLDCLRLVHTYRLAGKLKEARALLEKLPAIAKDTIEEREEWLRCLAITGFLPERERITKLQTLATTATDDAVEARTIAKLLASVGRAVEASAVLAPFEGAEFAADRALIAIQLGDFPAAVSAFNGSTVEKLSGGDLTRIAAAYGVSGKFDYFRSLPGKRFAEKPEILRMQARVMQLVDLGIGEAEAGMLAGDEAMQREGLSTLVDEAELGSSPTARALKAMRRLKAGQVREAAKLVADADLAKDDLPLEVRGRVRMEQENAGAFADLEKAVDRTTAQRVGPLESLAKAYRDAGRKADEAVAEAKLRALGK